MGPPTALAGFQFLECFEMLNTNQSVLVAGGGGFIGGHLVADLLK
jgi:hypothetical protein